MSAKGHRAGAAADGHPSVPRRWEQVRCEGSRPRPCHRGRSPLMTRITRKRPASAVGTASTACGVATSRCAVVGWPHPIQSGHAKAPTPFKSSAAATRCCVVAHMPARLLTLQPRFLQLLFYLLQVLLHSVRALLGVPFQLGADPARDLLEHAHAHRFAQRFELRLLVCIEQRVNLLVKGHADLPQFFDLFRAAENGVRLECPQLFDLVIQNRDDLLLLLPGQSQLGRELVGNCRQRIQRDLRRRNDLVVGIAKLVSPGGVVVGSKFVESPGVRILRDPRDELAVLDLVSAGLPFVTLARRRRSRLACRYFRRRGKRSSGLLP